MIVTQYDSNRTCDQAMSCSHASDEEHIEAMALAAILSGIWPTYLYDAYCDSKGYYGSCREYIRDRVFYEFERLKDV